MNSGEVWCVEEPLVHVLSGSQRGRRCDDCFLSPSAKLLRCSACGIAWYCNKRCQKSAWKMHKAECSSLQRVAPNVPSESVRLMFRLLLLRKSGVLSAVQLEVFGKKRSFVDLMSHVDEIKRRPSQQNNFVTMIATLKALAPDETFLPPPAELLEIFGKVCTNSFSICDEEMQPVGVGIYIRCSALDHSCTPNAVAVFSGKTLTVRCTEKVTHTSKLRISYIDQLSTTAERRAQLQEQYCFTCQCPLCEESSEDAKKLAIKCADSHCEGFITEANCAVYRCDTCQRVIQSADEIIQQLTSALHKAKTIADKALEVKKNGGPVEDIYKMCSDCLRSVSDILHPHNVYCVTLRDRLLDACIDMERWEEALKNANSNTLLYQQYYQHFHPSLGLHYFKTGKLQSLLGDLSGALRSLQQAEEILHITHGKDHSLCVDLQHRLTLTREELRSSSLHINSLDD